METLVLYAGMEPNGEIAQGRLAIGPQVGNLPHAMMSKNWGFPILEASMLTRISEPGGGPQLRINC
jgi:hypothetical protein